MEPITKKEMSVNLGLIKKLICRVMDYNLKYDVHIFIDVIPHLNGVYFRIFNTSNKRWRISSDSEMAPIYYDGHLQTVMREIKVVESWLTEK